MALAGALVGLGVLVVLDVIQGATDAASAVGAGLSQASVIDITFLVSPSQQAKVTGTSSPGPVGP